MRRLSIVLAGIALLAAGCGGEQVAAPLPQTVQGTLPKQPTQTTAVKGDPAAGKSVFSASGCSGCHTYAPAGSSANIGPNLDQLASYAKKAGQPLQSFTAGAITSPPPAYVPPGFPTNVMPTTFGSSLSAKQLADLVAFLTKK